MTELNPKKVSEYVIAAFSEAHGMSVSDAREFIDRYGGTEYIERCYKSFAHMMAPDMVKTLRRHIEWAGGTCPLIVRTDI